LNWTREQTVRPAPVTQAHNPTGDAWPSFSSDSVFNRAATATRRNSNRASADNEVWSCARNSPNWTRHGAARPPPRRITIERLSTEEAGKQRKGLTETNGGVNRQSAFSSAGSVHAVGIPLGIRVHGAD